jgi:hypothetical protein
MLIPVLLAIFNRDLEKLKQEIELYINESSLWVIDEQIANSSGNLCLHLIGNLNQYIGAELGKTGYIRKRDDEFSSKNIPRKELISKIEATITMVENTLSTLKEAELGQVYPGKSPFENCSTAYFLTHLTTHLAYHLGQINYHRRLLDKK